MAHVVSQIDAPLSATVDRSKVCPMLLRIFCAVGGHNHPQEYDRGQTPANEMQIYTWKDCTLRELANLIKDINPEARRKGVEFRFATVAPHPRNARFILTDIGNVVNGQRGSDDVKELGQCSFEPGDYLDVALVSHSAGGGGGFRNGDRDRGRGGGDRRFSRDEPPPRRSFRD